MTILLWILAYLAVGYITALVLAVIERNDHFKHEGAGYWFGITIFWPLVWLLGIGVGIYALFLFPGWLSYRLRSKS